MGPHSGKFGLVNGIEGVREWQVNDGHAPAVAVASNTAFGTHREQGVHDWSGSFVHYHVDPPVMPGETLAFVGYTAPDNDAGGSGMRYSGNGVVSQLQVGWAWANGEIITMAYEFGGHLKLTPANGVAPVDSSNFAGVPVAGSAGIDFSTNGSTWTAIDHIAQAQLTVLSSLVPYVNSGTVVDGQLWTGRKSGPIDWNVVLTVQDTIRSQLTKGQEVWLRLYVDATRFWQLSYGIVREFTGIQVNRQTGAIVGYTIPIEMKACAAADGSLGEIILPDESTWWPVAQT
jgi:hypothetical protein